VTQRVSRGDSFTLPIVVEKGSCVHWRFHVRDYDVAFSVTFSTDDGVHEPRIVSVQPRLRINHDQSSYVAEADGTVALTWDNSYSRFRSKEITYATCVEAENSVEHPLVDTPYGPGLMVEYRDSDSMYERLPRAVCRCDSQMPF